MIQFHNLKTGEVLEVTEINRNTFNALRGALRGWIKEGTRSIDISLHKSNQSLSFFCWQYWYLSDIEFVHTLEVV